MGLRVLLQFPSPPEIFMAVLTYLFICLDKLWCHFITIKKYPQYIDWDSTKFINLGQSDIIAFKLITLHPTLLLSVLDLLLSLERALFVFNLFC